MKLGVTGTRNGMTVKQFEAVESLIYRLKPSELHHGDCVGVDNQAAEVAWEAKVRVICHPPIDQRLRAFNARHAESREPLTHFARNRAIVDESDAMLVVPMQGERQERGGTWYTFDYAVKRGKPVYLVKPDGTVTTFGVAGE